MELKRLLLVEGEDDARVLSHICKQRNLPVFCEIKQLQGVERLLESLPVQLKAQSSEDILGVVIDADENVQSRWQALHKILKTLSSVSRQSGMASLVHRPGRSFAPRHLPGLINLRKPGNE